MALTSQSTGALIVDTGITNDVLNLRTQPDAAAPTMRVLPRGTVLAVLERRGDWLRVQVPDGTSGFVATMFVDLQPLHPVKTSVTLTPTAPTITVHSSPAVTDSPDNRVAQVKNGDALIPLEDEFTLGAKLGTSAMQNLWIRVRTPDGVTGYVGAWLVQRLG
jgi:N-acetylmuramoyl-L-alanine amidase